MTGTPLPTTNQVATGINSAIGGIGGDLISVAEGLIIADVPFLGAPVVKQIWEALFNWIAGYFVKAAQTGATFAVIDVQVNQEENSMSSALAALVAAEKSGDQNAIQSALQAYQKAQSALLNSNGSATP